MKKGKKDPKVVAKLKAFDSNKYAKNSLTGDEN